MKTFSDLVSGCHSLLDRWEASGQSASRLFSKVTHPHATRFTEIEADERRCERWSDAIEVKNGTTSTWRVKLINPERLYHHLGRPQPDMVLETTEQLYDLFGGELALKSALDDVCVQWKRNKEWNSVKPGEVGVLEQLFKCVLAIRENREDLDFRTFLARHAFPSKFIERNMARLSKLLALFDTTTGVEPEDILKSYGLTKIRQPLLIRGNLSQRGHPLNHDFAYIGLPIEDVTRTDVRLVESPKAVLFIENMVSFVRFCAEEPNLDTLVVYTAGFPSRQTIEVIRRLIMESDQSCPIYHWGDIDGSGIAIFELIRTALAQSGLDVQALGMTRTLLDKHGTSDGWVRVKPKPDWVLHDLAQLIYDHKITAEQESIDPEYIRTLL